MVLQFTNTGEYVGHYDCILEDQEEEEEPVHRPEISSLLQALSPLPRIRNPRKRTRKSESAAILTSSPYKTYLSDKANKVNKMQTSKERKKTSGKQAKKKQSQRSSKSKGCGSEVGLRRDHGQPVTVTSVMKSGPAYTACSPGPTANLEKNRFAAVYARNGLIWIALRNPHILCV